MKPKARKLRSSFEDTVVPAAIARGATYERLTLDYTSAPKRYKPDLVLDNAIVVEIKGWFTPADRAKTEAVLRAYPGLELRFVFQRPQNTLSKHSKTTYAQWCDARGIQWAEGSVPASWYDEPVHEASAKVLAQYGRLVKKAVA